MIDGVQEARAGARLRQLSFGGMGGARMLGVLHDAVVFLVEQLQGAKRCQRHTFRFHKQDTQEEELPVNPTGCARSEVYLRWGSILFNTQCTIINTCLCYFSPEMLSFLHIKLLTQ